MRLSHLVFGNARRNGRWLPLRQLFAAPRPAVDLATATAWPRPENPRNTEQRVASLTCVKPTNGGAVLALREFFEDGNSHGLVVSAISLSPLSHPAGCSPTEKLRETLTIPLEVYDTMACRLRASPQARELELPADALLPPQTPIARRHASLARALMNGRRVALVAQSEAECARSIAAVLGLLEPGHSAHTSWSTWETDASAGLALIGVVRGTWTQDDGPESHSYLVSTQAVDAYTRGHSIVQELSVAVAPPRPSQLAGTCPLCGRPTWRQRTARPVQAHGRNQRLKTALLAPCLNPYACSTCGLAGEAPNPLPVVLVPASPDLRGSAIAWTSREAVAADVPLHRTRATQSLPGGWAALEMEYRTGSAPSRYILVLEPPDLRTQPAALHELTARHRRGLLVVWAPQNGSDAYRQNRPPLARDAFRANELARIENLKNAGWSLTTANGREPIPTLILNWLKGICK